MSSQIRFAHLSDWHATTLLGAGRALSSPKRLSGWASWRLSRRHRHSVEVLEAAFRDVRSRGVDRILVTGDLTHVSLPQEFLAAADQLAALGTPEQVFLIPGNHDCYVPVAAAESWDRWADYLSGTAPEHFDAATADCLAPASPPGIAPRHEDFPTLRVHGALATIGLCSAVPTPIFRAGGQLGVGQLERLERLLVALREQGLCRVVMIHHPVVEHAEPPRRRLWDGDALRAVLARAGAELVLHGHKHRRRVNRLPGPAAEIPVIGVPSASEIGSKPDRRAQYHVYSVEQAAGPARFRIEAEIRGYDAQTGEFAQVDEPLL